MARLSVILAHPRHGSFNHAIAATAVQTLEAQGHEVWFHDLYQENFDPVLLAPELEREAVLPPDLAQHCREIAQAQGIVIVHPNWWGQPPAILKGWVDRVLRPEVAYRFREGDAGDGVPVGLLKAKAAVVFTTSNTPVSGNWPSSATPWKLSGKTASLGCAASRSFSAKISPWW